MSDHDRIQIAYSELDLRRTELDLRRADLALARSIESFRENATPPNTKAITDRAADFFNFLSSAPTSPPPATVGP